MAAPSATARGTPGGIKLRDGYQTLITFARFTTVKFWEKMVTPSGYDGGEAIDQTTMWNTDRKTKAPQALWDKTDVTATVAYDPSVLDQIEQMINIPDTITVKHPDGSTEADFGYLQKFEPQENEPGKQPEAQITIVFTGTDSSGAEQVPVRVQVTGT